MQHCRMIRGQTSERKLRKPYNRCLSMGPMSITGTGISGTETPLYIAMREGCYIIAELLFNRGADVSAPSWIGCYIWRCTMCSWTSRSCNLSVARMCVRGWTAISNGFGANVLVEHDAGVV
ncbi:hypothetical protein B0F90DRAFT_1297048 [Multifurca ochricompacta]|uniref:Ankyrin repeat protein n=1 Tax=Multifurca ochricompacta TaxID=376703 RepID=A0AAD4LXB2_9AGAM|nr:hypothetical protein B0F90DRAFT_1297048 [Multifurca ochricompacta]